MSMQLGSDGTVARKHFKRVTVPNDESLYLSNAVKPFDFKDDEKGEPKLSSRYKDRNIELLEEGLVAVGHKGWSTVFASPCSRSGKWYYEVVLVESRKELNFIGNNARDGTSVKGHVRVGYACRYQAYSIPAGSGDFGYVISDSDGTIINGGIRRPYACKFGIGDVIGCYISLEDTDIMLDDPRKDIRLLEHLHNGILCDPNDPPTRIESPGSYVAFSINGVMQAKCQLRVWEGEYHPAISLYMGATIRINFGPTFRYPPPEEYKPCCLMGRPMIP
ncbi:set1/ash2 histone methyltransferase complex subunit ash2 like protein [Babesia gibsoni]|uniref:Set1/ash2 histone methyltransferase complex subunit ash2 like protein n=1 Tax=Babesia gibsoni TaxID=33632 RepID=A0AAD8LGR9_BABGI|nr:set1/ash2 histone methyltransferase complex subunit ash2 like protein [Babesia gibsoni]